MKAEAKDLGLPIISGCCGNGILQQFAEKSHHFFGFLWFNWWFNWTKIVHFFISKKVGKVPIAKWLGRSLLFCTELRKMDHFFLKAHVSACPESFGIFWNSVKSCKKSQQQQLKYFLISNFWPIPKNSSLSLNKYVTIWYVAVGPQLRLPPLAFEVLFQWASVYNRNGKETTVQIGQWCFNQPLNDIICLSLVFWLVFQLFLFFLSCVLVFWLYCFLVFSLSLSLWWYSVVVGGWLLVVGCWLLLLLLVLLLLLLVVVVLLVLLLLLTFMLRLWLWLWLLLLLSLFKKNSFVMFLILIVLWFIIIIIRLLIYS